MDNTPAAIAISPPAPLTLQSGATVTLSATVTAKDGHTVTSATVTWTSTDATVAIVNGGAITGTKVGTATVTASSGSVSASVAVTVTPGVAAALAIRTQPGGGPLGSPLPVQPVIEVRDAAGNLVTSSTAPVTASIATGGGGLSGPTTVNAVAGVATFSGLTIVGAAADRQLGFTSPGLAAVASATITLTLPPVTMLVLDTGSVTFPATVGSAPLTKTLTIANGGSIPFTSVTLDPVVYDTGQPTGWLAASLDGITPPITLTLTASPAPLAIGTYHATVRINAPGATNTPASVSVTLTVAPSFSLQYGTAAEKVRVLDIGGAYTPTLVALLSGVQQPLNTVSLVSRATSVATVDPSGRITAVGPGQSWVAATSQGIGDSVFVIVTRSTTGPLLRVNLSTFVAHAGDTLVVTFTLDPRGTLVGGATVIVGYELENSMFQLISARPPSQTPQPVASASSPGVYKVTIAAAAGLTAPVDMLQLTLVAGATGLSGYLTFAVLDIVGPDGTDVSALTTSTRYPVIIR